MTQKKYIYKKIRLGARVCLLLLTLVGIFAGSLTASAAPLSLIDETAGGASVTAYDTLSGIDGMVKIAGGVRGTTTTVTVADPAGMQARYTKILDAQGNATITIPSSITIRTGLYTVRAVLGTATLTTTFTVFGDISANDLPSNIGGDDDADNSENLVAAAGVVDHFEIENIASSVTAGERLSFTVNVVDSDGETVPSYRGTIRFSSTDRNAQLPGDYTFIAGDQGKKTFDLGLTLRTTGSQRLLIDDRSDAELRGEKIIQVVRGSFEAGTGELYITKPSAGTYSSTTLQIEGGAPANVRVRFYDNNQQIGEKQSDTGGRFSFQTPLLRDGPHRLYVATDTSESQVVEVTIDSTPARVENVQIAETTLAPGATTTITVTSDPDVSQIRATIGDYITDLVQDPQNKTIYRGQLVAPQAVGTYTVNVIVSDRFGNSADTAEVGTIKVDAALQNEGSFSFVIPSTVTNVQAQPVLNGVLLSWTAARAEAGIASYRIYYGTTPNDLAQVLNTNTAATNFTVQNLQLGTNYYFRVSAVDVRGNESDNLSNMVSAAPSNVNTGASAGNSLVCDPAPCPVAVPPLETPRNGPALLIPFIVSSLAGVVSLRKKNR